MIISLEEKDVLDDGFGSDPDFRYCPMSTRLREAEIGAQNLAEVEAMLRARGFEDLDLRPIEIASREEGGAPAAGGDDDFIPRTHVLEHLPRPIEAPERMKDWVTAVVLEGEDTKMVGKNPVIDCVWKARHEVVPDICLNDAPPLRSLLNDSNRTVCGVQSHCTPRQKAISDDVSWVKAPMPAMK